MNVMRQSLLRCNASLLAVRTRPQSTASADKVFRHFEAGGFSVPGIKRNKAIWPLLIIMGGAVVGLGGFIIYSSNTRENVIFNKSKLPYIETMDPMEPKVLKMRVINQQYEPNPELKAALQYKNEEADH